MLRKIWVPAGLVFAGLIIWSLVFHPWGWAYGIGVHPYPASSSTPWTYQLLSGFVPALTVISLVTFLAGAWHHVNCHAEHCWRIGKHKVNGTPWCSAHHETARPEFTTEELLRAILAEVQSIAIKLGAP